jgi:DNA-binding GntR family transcriptional regulator
MNDETLLSPLDSSSNETLAGRIADQLKRKIITGLLKPGQKLVEKEIAAAFNVSRTPLREALARLVNIGVAVSIPYRGIFVRCISAVHAREIYELRIGIEGVAAMFAAERASDNDLSRLKNLLSAMDREEDTGDDAASLKLLNEQFHRAIAEATGNTVLVAQIDDLWGWVSLTRTNAWSATGRGGTSRIEHHAICEAIFRHDPAKARQLAEDHARRAWTNVEPFLVRTSATTTNIGSTAEDSFRHAGTKRFRR